MHTVVVLLVALLLAAEPAFAWERRHHTRAERRVCRDTCHTWITECSWALSPRHIRRPTPKARHTCRFFFMSVCLFLGAEEACPPYEPLAEKAS